jgi:putative radical SAM enzyme (TIGR03279 family)
MVKITEVEKNSRAEAAGILSGDTLISINANEINDVLDYRFYLAEKTVEFKLLRNEQEINVLISKGEYEDVGLVFETPLMDKKHSCKNGCVFCFIDQNPEGLRESLYFKDDDSRLSFIHGNYITLTNVNDKDVERIVKMRFSPINISIHTTNPELRVKMMKNKRSGEVLKYLSRFKEAGLAMCGQIVLCKGLNDGDELLRSMNDLAQYYPELSSVSIVPSGLTKFRDKLYPLAEFSKSDALAVIKSVEKFAKKHKKKHGSRLFFVADEFYLKAGLKLPKSDYYEDYPQLENGVGMLRSFSDEFKIAAEDIQEYRQRMTAPRTVSVATGVASYSMIAAMAKKLEKLIPGLKINVIEIKNRFFGESITVSGLLTGRDICEQLTGLVLGDALVVPGNALRYPEEDFLCGMKLTELEEKLGVPTSATGGSGYEFLEALLGVQ